MNTPNANSTKILSCPLCGGTQKEAIDRMDSSDLVTLYNHFLGDDIQYLFAGVGLIQMLRCVDCDLMFTWPFIPGDERFYSLVSLKEDYYPAVKSEFEVASQHTAQADHVLDIGCGVGEFASIVNRYTGIDINDTALDTARENGLDVFKGTIEDHASTHFERYDVVAAFHVLEHVINPSGFLESALGCIRNGGKLIVAVPSAESFITRMENHLLNLPPHHLTWWTDAALKNIADLYKVELLEIYHEPVQNNHLDTFVHTYYLDKLRTLMDLDRELINTRPSMSQRIANRLALYLKKGTKRFFHTRASKSIGHTVTAVYHKH